MLLPSLVDDFFTRPASAAGASLRFAAVEFDDAGSVVAAEEMRQRPDRGVGVVGATAAIVAAPEKAQSWSSSLPKRPA